MKSFGRVYNTKGGSLSGSAVAAFPRNRLVQMEKKTRQLLQIALSAMGTGLLLVPLALLGTFLRLILEGDSKHVGLGIVSLLLTLPARAMFGVLTTASWVWWIQRDRFESEPPGSEEQEGVPWLFGLALLPLGVIVPMAPQWGGHVFGCFVAGLSVVLVAEHYLFSSSIEHRFTPMVELAVLFLLAVVALLGFVFVVPSTLTPIFNPYFTVTVAIFIPVFGVFFLSEPNKGPTESSEK